MIPPADALAAVTHADPYPYYAMLVRQKPFHFDAGLKSWIAASAEAAEAVLQSPLCRVRPPGEPVPAAICGAAAGQVFGQLARMTDGPEQAAMKQAILAALSPLPHSYIAGIAWHEARRLLRREHMRLDDFIFALPVHTVAALLGFRDRLRPAMVELTGGFVRGIAPNATPVAAQQANDAATALSERLRALLADGARSAGDGVLWRLQEAAGARIEAVLANAIGLLMQSYDATAGLLGNAWLALGGDSDLRRAVMADIALLPDFIAEVLRHDAPIQNTRRFVAEDSVILGQAVKAGDAILVVLAAANRDPALNPDPDRCLIARQQRRLLTFGNGRHACPGERIALATAAAGIEALLDSRVDFKPERSIRYRPSVNARIPVFQEQTP